MPKSLTFDLMHFCLTFAASTSFYTDDELKIRSMPRITNATYDKKSIMSVSSIAAKLGEPETRATISCFDFHLNF